jgi:hypothetical protein
MTSSNNLPSYGGHQHELDQASNESASTVYHMNVSNGTYGEPNANAVNVEGTFFS